MDINSQLICAVRSGNLAKARHLIYRYGLSYSKDWAGGYVLLRLATENRHNEIAKLLLTQGARVNSKNQNLLKTPLHFAVINGATEIVEMLIDRGAMINAKSECGTPLHNSIENNGKIEIVQLLLNHGACVNSVYTSGYRKSYTPLHLAVKWRSREMAKLLLSRNADVNAKGTDGITALHIACENGHAQIVEDLLNHGACLNSVTIRH